MRAKTCRALGGLCERTCLIIVCACGSRSRNDPAAFCDFLPLVWLVGGGKVHVLEVANIVDAPQHVGWVGWGGC